MGRSSGNQSNGVFKAAEVRTPIELEEEFPEGPRKIKRYDPVAPINKQRSWTENWPRLKERQLVLTSTVLKLWTAGVVSATEAMILGVLEMFADYHQTRQPNARLTDQDIADIIGRVGLSRSMVSRMMQRMTAAGILDVLEDDKIRMVMLTIEARQFWG